jgi:hypothetical protein
VIREDLGFSAPRAGAIMEHQENSATSTEQRNAEEVILRHVFGIEPTGEALAGDRILKRVPSRYRNCDHRLDREYAAKALQQLGEAQPIVGPQCVEYWKWFRSLSWIKYRCREKLDAVNESNFRQIVWYDNKCCRCDLTLITAIQHGHIEAFDPESGLKIPREKDFADAPNVRFRALDIIERWPAAFLTPLTFQPLSAEDPADDAVGISSNLDASLIGDVSPKERARHMKIFAWMVCQRANQPKRGGDIFNLLVRTAPVGTFEPPIVGETALRESWHALFPKLKQRGRISRNAWAAHVKTAQEFLTAEGISIPQALPGYTGSSGQPDYSWPPQF